MAGRLIRHTRMSNRGGQRRKTTWIASTIPAGVNALASGVTAFDQQLVCGTAFGNEEVTIVRTRGRLFVQSDQVAAREECFGALGFAIVTDPAAAVGGTSLPGPLTEASSDFWYVWVPWACDHDTLSNNPYNAEFDSKAQRKFVPGETIVTMMENSASGFGVEYELNFRELFKLS